LTTVSRIRPTLRRDERGQILLVAALLSTALAGLVGLVIDGGNLAAQRRHAQNVADAAALAGARALFEGRSISSAQSTALYYAQANGYGGASGAGSVTVTIPPASGEHEGDANFVQAAIDGGASTFFIHVLVPGSPGVRARAVAGISDFPEEYALVALNPTACRAFEQVGSASLTVVGGGVMVNSACSSDALRKTGSGDLIVEGSIDVTGGYSTGGNSGTVSPTPNSFVPWTVDDPLAGLPTPPLGAPAPGSPGTAAQPVTWKFTSPGDFTLEPGTYYGGLDINCSGCTISLQPGVYVMAGGGFSKAANPTIIGDEVMIYLTDCNGPTNQATCTGDGVAQPVRLSGGGVLDLSPPTSGTYQGITFWQDRAIADAMTINGDNSLVQGVFYAPGAGIELGGGADLGVVQLVADTVRVSGNAPIDLEYGAFRTFEAPDVVLAE